MGTRCGLRSASSVASRATLAISSLARIFDEMKGRLSGMAGNNTSPIILVLSVPYTWHLDDSILFSDMLNRRDGRLLRWGIFPDDCISLERHRSLNCVSDGCGTQSGSGFSITS